MTEGGDLMFVERDTAVIQTNSSSKVFVNNTYTIPRAVVQVLYIGSAAIPHTLMDVSYIQNIYNT